MTISCSDVCDLVISKLSDIGIEMPDDFADSCAPVVDALLECNLLKQLDAPVFVCPNCQSENTYEVELVASNDEFRAEYSCESCNKQWSIHAAPYTWQYV